MLQRPGAVEGSVPCSKVSPQLYLGWRERWLFTPPPTIPAGPETRTCDFWVTSMTLYPLGHNCPTLLCCYRPLCCIFPHGIQKQYNCKEYSCRSWVPSPVSGSPMRVPSPVSGSVFVWCQPCFNTPVCNYHIFLKILFS